MEDKQEVTGIPLWIVLRTLYESRRKHWTANEVASISNHEDGGVSMSPALVLKLLAAAQGSPTEEEYKAEVEDKWIPDYFKGSPMKVTTEFYRDDLTRVWHDHPEATRCFIGRLDLYERDNGKESRQKFIQKMEEYRHAEN